MAFQENYGLVWRKLAVYSC